MPIPEPVLYLKGVTTLAASGGEIQVKMFYSSAVVKSAETFDAAATGFLDRDMTGGAYPTGKNPAFQFAGDLMGGYSNPSQQLAWLLHGDGYAQINELYNAHDMEFVGRWIPGQESLASTKPIRGVADLKNWKFWCSGTWVHHLSSWTSTRSLPRSSPVSSTVPMLRT